MADKKFSEFDAKPSPAPTDELVGFSGAANIRVPVSSLTDGGGTEETSNTYSETTTDTGTGSRSKYSGSSMELPVEKLVLQEVESL